MRAQKGVALVSVLSIVLVLAVLLSTLVGVSHAVWAMGDRERQFAHCSACATGVAQSMLKVLEAGEGLQAATSLQFDPVTVDTRTTVEDGLTLVKVEAKIGDVTDTISFTYDTIAHRLRAWQDNGPGIVE
ncbi:hypothetical protein [Alicyclobacillus acidoterrestris]|uniref:Uncharacterized protein n=1 Tax=Alicyclobacillus acidoterrestris (strain ATCC 49025 / DSM 3922 / CIP 106132 / NCIMB 13137 / GD3B) TaxID=1356854 RepID=T0DHE5_ALIAG|nr:hypothetical protein [Alicyclobacillus acidoterrestris]EPZ48976.1 hypothetical protein N007_03810 [Alicyclobacillus acidoterrestris ATCC 49025]UNO47502.1 hypothetical protein K1I37_12380 [Alicyclobacillus acidoterrestris]